MIRICIPYFTLIGILISGPQVWRADPKKFYCEGHLIFLLEITKFLDLNEVKSFSRILRILLYFLSCSADIWYIVEKIDLKHFELAFLKRNIIFPGTPPDRLPALTPRYGSNVVPPAAAFCWGSLLRRSLAPARTCRPCVPPRSGSAIVSDTRTWACRPRTSGTSTSSRCGHRNHSSIPSLLKFFV